MTRITINYFLFFFILDFANQLIEFSTGHEHRQYIGLLEKLHQFSKK
jgi:hypothetical protein